MNLTTEDIEELLNTKYASEEINVQPFQKVEVSGPNVDVMTAARSLIGTPYVYGGTSSDEFDCSGFVQYVYQIQDIVIPRTVREIWNFSQPIHSPIDWRFSIFFNY